MKRSRGAEEQGSKGAFTFAQKAAQPSSSSAQSGADRRRPTAHAKPRAGGGRPPTDVICGFCGGKGRDPFGIMSPLATCQVCGGTGQHALQQPTAPCAFCQGTGVHPLSRLTCTTCGGVGTVAIPDDAVTCPCCGGSGRAADYVWPDSPLSCGCCHGKGVVAADG